MKKICAICMALLVVFHIYNVFGASYIGTVEGICAKYNGIMSKVDIPRIQVIPENEAIDDEFDNVTVTLNDYAAAMFTTKKDSRQVVCVLVVTTPQKQLTDNANNILSIAALCVACGLVKDVTEAIDFMQYEISLDSDNAFDGSVYAFTKNDLEVSYMQHPEYGFLFEISLPEM